MTTELPTTDGHYRGQGGDLWTLANGLWFAGVETPVPDLERVKPFAPFTRLIADLPIRTKEEYAERLALWKRESREKGYDLDSQPQKDDEGHLTLQGVREAQEQFCNNLTLTLKTAIEEAGGRDTEAGKTIGNLWHGIVSHESYIHRALKDLEKK